jgi:hypothetical protein
VLLQVLEQQQLLSGRVVEELTLVRDCCFTMQTETRELQQHLFCNSVYAVSV